MPCGSEKCVARPASELVQAEMFVTRARSRRVYVPDLCRKSLVADGLWSVCGWGDP